MTAEEALQDLYLRTKGADETFSRMLEREPTNARLSGKRQGVRLVLGYVVDALEFCTPIR